jgi:excisionase family DNA binding protein
MSIPDADESTRLERMVVPLWPDAGQALGLSRNCTYDSARRGEIPTIRFGRTIRVPIAALKRLLESAGQKPGD